MEREYLLWHTGAGCSVGCLVFPVAIVAAVLVPLLGVRPIVATALVSPLVVLILLWSVRADEGARGRNPPPPPERSGE